MTDKDIADKVYIEPLNAQTLKKVILKEKPDSILPTLGGQNGLNLAMELYEEGFLDEQNVKMIGTVASACLLYTSFVILLLSLDATAKANCSGVKEDRTDNAAFGPTPETDISRRKQFNSSKL